VAGFPGSASAARLPGMRGEPGPKRMKNAQKDMKAVRKIPKHVFVTPHAYFPCPTPRGVVLV